MTDTTTTTIIIIIIRISITLIIKRKSIKESASAPVSSTKPSKESSKVIKEEAAVADRFRKLAGILKG